MPKTTTLTINKETSPKKKFRHEINHYDTKDTKGYLVYFGQFPRHRQLLVLGAHHILKKCRGLEVTYYPKKDNYHNILPKHEFKRGRLEILWRLSGSMREVNVWWVRIKPYEPHPLPWYFTPSAALFLLSTFLLCNAHTSSTPLYSALLAGIAGAAFATYSYIRHNMPPNYEEEE